MTTRIEKWLKTAKVGEDFVYFTGNLLDENQRLFKKQTEKRQKEIRDSVLAVQLQPEAIAAWEASRQGKVFLFQRRIKGNPGQYDYCARVISPATGKVVRAERWGILGVDFE